MKILIDYHPFVLEQTYILLNDNKNTIQDGKFREPEELFPLFNTYQIDEVVLRGNKKMSKNFVMDISNKLPKIKYTFMKG